MIPVTSCYMIHWPQFIYVWTICQHASVICVIIIGNLNNMGAGFVIQLTPPSRPCLKTNCQEENYYSTYWLGQFGVYCTTSSTLACTPFSRILCNGVNCNTILGRSSGQNTPKIHALFLVIKVNFNHPLCCHTFVDDFVQHEK